MDNNYSLHNFTISKKYKKLKIFMIIYRSNLNNVLVYEKSKSDTYSYIIFSIFLYHLLHTPRRLFKHMLLNRTIHNKN